jgi:nucleotide-binding universal stress UspA family protein
VARRGLLADLIVLARDAQAEGLYVPAFETALFSLGRPVLLTLPEKCERLGERVGFAWNGSREAARALTAALPLLAGARQVTVIALGERKKGQVGVEAVLSYLRLHGVAAEARVLETAWKGQRLLEELGILSADLLVMGAYGHSRLREIILGGATQEIVEQARLPVFFAH